MDCNLFADIHTIYIDIICFIYSNVCILKWKAELIRLNCLMLFVSMFCYWIIICISRSLIAVYITPHTHRSHQDVHYTTTVHHIVHLYSDTHIPLCAKQ